VALRPPPSSARTGPPPAEQALLAPLSTLAISATFTSSLSALQSNSTSQLVASDNKGALLTSLDGSSALYITAGGRLVFANLATNTTLWSPKLGGSGSAAAASGTHKLELTAEGEVQLSSAGKVTWRAGTRGKARGPVRLTASGQDLALQDVASGKTIWLAPVACSTFGAAQLPAFGQCGAEAPYNSTCCPTGFMCSRQSSQMWSCQPSGALDSCSGPKALALAAPCGGQNLCGEDAACSSLCCSEGTFCRRQNAFTWTCAPMASFPGGLVNSAG
jgi:hypothetical protein